MQGPALRAQLRVVVTVLWAAVTGSLIYLGASVPEELIVLWGAVYFAVFGLAEAFWDWKHPQPPPAELPRPPPE